MNAHPIPIMTAGAAEAGWVRVMVVMRATAAIAVKVMETIFVDCYEQR
jgi:hypothetical protein